MANIKSQKKRIKTNEKARLRNRAAKAEMKTAVRRVREAVEAGDMQQGAALADEQDAFLTEHVLPWLAPWRYAVEKYARTDYYRGVGAFVFGLIACYAERFGIRFDGKASAFKRRK